jgi:hypothetical protein
MNRETLEQRAARILAPETEEQRRDRFYREHMARVRASEALAARMAHERMIRHKQGGAVALAFLVLLTMTGAAVAAGHYAELRVRNALALQCAKHSHGTDSEIARCYASRDLPTPEGI